jgi:para-aminobenzoate synthetase component 1
MSEFPYPLLSKSELTGLMNKWSVQGKPFFVLIRFDAKGGYCIPIDDIDEAWLRFAFHSKAGNETAGVPGWEVEPVSKDAYARKFDCVMKHIRRGNSFLTNLTQPSRVLTDVSLLHLYSISVAPYKVWMRDGFVCFSPECFVKIEEGCIRTFPMKGTVDASIPDAMESLLQNEKEKAEHATIVDLLRNDLSIVASGVELVRYRYVDRIRTHKGELLQVSSEIRGNLPPDYRSQLGDIVFALLPAGSVSGAPKPATLAIIDEAEGYDRGFYTGICGYFDGKDFDSAVMIRFVEQSDEGLLFKSGGGITFRSEMEKEYQELIQKVYVPLY